MRGARSAAGFFRAKSKLVVVVVVVVVVVDGLHLTCGGIPIEWRRGVLLR